MAFVPILFLNVSMFIKKTPCIKRLDFSHREIEGILGVDIDFLHLSWKSINEINKKWDSYDAFV